MGNDQYIIDNINYKFEQALNKLMQGNDVERTDFCVGYFNLRGWNFIADRIDQLPGGIVREGDKEVHRTCRLLVGMFKPENEIVRALYSKTKKKTDSNEVNRAKLAIAREFRTQLTLGFPSKEDEKTLRQLSEQLKSKKVCVKLSVKQQLHAKLYIAYRPTMDLLPRASIMGSSNLTFSGMSGQGELNATFSDSLQNNELVNWFEDRWNDPFCVDITEELIDAIDSSWASIKVIPPYYIYLKAAYFLSQEARSGISEYGVDPIFSKILFEFQKNAVQIATRYLMNDKHKGAMIGDVVGLGKTFTACAISKLFEEHMSGSTLIICPANLIEMWDKHVRKFDLKANIISNAQHIDPESMRYYRLVIIDESQNLRNSDGKRYKEIKRFIESQDNSVLLLSATPYNRDFTDLSAQLRLFISEDQDLGIRPEAYIKEIGGDNAFKRKHGDVFMRSIKAFELSDHVEDWNELMKLFLVRRTRTFIKENYAETDESNGRKYLQYSDGRRSYFPDRVPRAVKFRTSDGDQYSRLYSPEMINLMEELVLPRYGLVNYESDAAVKQATDKDKRLLENLSRAGKRMMGFCRSTFFKRIDSSGFSFLLTLYRHCLRNCVYIYAITNGLDLPIGDENNLPDDFKDDDDLNGEFGKDRFDGGSDGTLVIPTDMDVYMAKAKEYYSTIREKGNVAWLSPAYFKRTLKSALNKDCQTIINMIKLCGAWDPANDPKLNELYQLVSTTHDSEKVLIFTQYSDTAEYIYRELKKRNVSNIGIATGKSSSPTGEAIKFSPISNEVEKVPPFEEQTRILVATDVLSEGQNLQDSHIIMNFDLPWAIIRLIQRAGRVDRIGQKSEKILCYSFFPAEGVESIINLRKRLHDRLAQATQTLGGDEIFFDDDVTNIKDLYNEKSGILDDDDDNEVDLSSYAYEIWNKAVKKDPKLKNIIPSLCDMAYSTRAVGDKSHEGVITFVRTKGGFDMLSWLSPDGKVISQSQKQILKAMACPPDTPAATPLDNHHELVADAAREVQSRFLNTNASGMLGSRFSTRSRIVNLLEDFYNNYEREQRNEGQNLFFTSESLDSLKGAINDIFNYTLLDSVKTTLGSMLRLHTISNEDIVEYVISLYRDNQLVHKPVADDKADDDTIVCSMGLRYIPE